MKNLRLKKRNQFIASLPISCPPIGNIKNCIKLTLNRYGNFIKWLRGDRNTEGIITTDMIKDQWEYDLPHWIRPRHIKKIEVI